MKDELSLDLAGSLGLVRNQTTDEMRVCGVQHAHQLVERLPVHHSHGLEGLLPFLGSGGDAVSEEFGHVRHGRLSEEIQTVVVKRISILCEPIFNIVANNTCGGRLDREFCSFIIALT